MIRFPSLLFAAALLVSFQVAGLKYSRTVLADDVIKVGVLHSVTGPLAISESVLRDVMLMLIDAQNAKGGLLGRTLEPVVLDPASDPGMFAEKLRQLLEESGVAVIFGGWTSSSRKAMIPVLRKHNGLLFYPVQYEGQESERNVFYTGAVPNQQALSAVDYLMHVDGVRRWYLIGSDYIYPRTTNRILEAYLAENEVGPEDIKIRYVPLGQDGWAGIVDEIKSFGRQGKRAGVVSTINGFDNLGFYRELAWQGIDAADIPVMAFSAGDEELAGLDTSGVEGHLSSWGYFQSVDDPANREFVKRWRAFVGDNYRVVNDPMEAHFIGFNMWVEAVRKAGAVDVDKVIDAMIGIKVPNLTGGEAEMLPNHHVTRPAMIGAIGSNGLFEVLWTSPEQLKADAWSDYLPESKEIIADWRPPISCGSYDAGAKTCMSPPDDAN
jgi:urea transport system substrate-binding protein